MNNRYLHPKLFILFIILLLSAGLCACGNTIDTISVTTETVEATSTMPDANPATTEYETEPRNETEAEVESNPNQEKPSHNIKDIDWKAFQAQLSTQDFETLQKYFPVLSGGEFIWIERQRDPDNPDNFLHKPQQAIIQDIHSDCDPPETLVSSLAFADVFQCGTQDIILYLYNMGGHYLILHEENGIIYGIDYPVRWFQGLQESGLYCSSGGAGYQKYYKMTFENGDYTEHLICIMDEGEFYIGEEKQGITHEEAWELYDIWRNENCQHDVIFHDPFAVNQEEVILGDY